MIKIQSLFGDQAKNHLHELAHLRMKIFREYPYLYDGSLEYESEYLNKYLLSPKSLLVLAMAEGVVVGASTAMPMDEAEAAFRKPLENAGLRTADVFYFGESVLLPEFRGKGIGHRFFDEREKHALDAGFKKTTFCAVIRPEDHPQRPPHGYRPHDSFWRKRGYRQHPDMVAELPWREIGGQEEIAHALVFWIREWA